MTTKAPKMVMNEWYGEIPVTLNRTLKKYNVPPASFSELEDVYELNDREIDLAQIERFIKKHSESGMYQAPWPLSYEEVLSA